MNGTNSLDETDSKPIQFCPVCYRKLASCLKFDPIMRYKALNEVCASFSGRFKVFEEWFGLRHQAIASILGDMKPPVNRN